MDLRQKRSYISLVLVSDWVVFEDATDVSVSRDALADNPRIRFTPWSRYISPILKYCIQNLEC
jgi:hypothetical protein